MLVFLSDIHLNDGTVCQHTNGDSATVFLSRLKSQIYSAGFRSDGTYNPITTVNVVMLGDVFDFIRSSRWHHDHRGPNNIRPWHDISDWHFVVKDICSSIIRQNQDFLDAFKKASLHGLDIPTPSGGHVRCNVDLYYMVGNHDWFLHVQDSRMNDVRAMIKCAFGLRHDQFVWSLDEFCSTTTDLRHIAHTHRVYFHHGDKLDAYNYHSFLTRDHASVGDAIVIELVTGFPVKVRHKLVKKFKNESIPEKLEKALQEIDNVRPATQVPVYIRHIIDEHTPKKYRKAVLEVLDDCVSRLVDSRIVKIVSKHDPLLTTKLSSLAFACKYLPISVLRGVANLLSLFPDDYAKSAAEESGIRNMYDYVVYGHTHEPAQPVGIGLKNNVPKVYINSSTWRPVHCEITNGKVDSGLPYFSYQNIAWVTFYANDERRGKRYEIWMGDMESANEL